MTLHSKTLYSLLFDNAYVRAFFRAAPGIQGWSMLGKAWWHTTEMLPSGAPKYDVVILDAPATGHGLEMLRIPKIIVDLAPTGILRRDAESALRLFQNPKETSIYVVTLPEELPTTETLELSRVLQRELGMTLTKIVMNGVAETLFSEEERATFLRWTVHKGLPESAFPLLAARSRALREHVLVQSRSRLQKELKVPMIELPLLLGTSLGAPEVRKLSAYFAAN